MARATNSPTRLACAVLDAMQGTVAAYDGARNFTYFNNLALQMAEVLPRGETGPWGETGSATIRA